MGDYGLGRPRERRMFALQWLVLVWWVTLAASQQAPPNCCATKTVGGVDYTFVREDNAAISYSCLSSCVYERNDQPGTAFCFAQGDQEVVCGDSTQGTTGGSNSGSKGYTQAWLRGPGDYVAHVHEGLELADASGFVAVGETSDENNYGQILVTRVDTEGNKVWSQKIGTQLSAAHTVVESGSNVIVGGGLYKAS